MLNIFPAVVTFFYFSFFSKSACLPPRLGPLEWAVKPATRRAVLLFIKQYRPLRFRYLFMIANIFDSFAKSGIAIHKTVPSAALPVPFYHSNIFLL